MGGRISPLVDFSFYSFITIFLFDFFHFLQLNYNLVASVYLLHVHNYDILKCISEYFQTTLHDQQYTLLHSL